MPTDRYAALRAALSAPPHGHVTPLPGRPVARCGGPAICLKCAVEQVANVAGGDTIAALLAERDALLVACKALDDASEEYDFDDGMGCGAPQEYWNDLRTAIDQAEWEEEE